MHVAASCGRLEVAGYLLEKGAKVNARNTDGQTPVHYITGLSQDPRKDFFEGVPFFRRPKVSAEDIKKRKTLFKRRIAMLSFLLDNGADVNALDCDGDTPLIESAKGGSLVIAKLLLARGARLDFISAIRLGRFDYVERILKSDPARVNVIDENGRSPLHIAAELEDPAAVKFLLARGAKLEVGEGDYTPLSHAIYVGRAATTAALLDGGADPNRAKYCKGPILNFAAMAGSLDLVKILLAGGARLDSTDNSNCNALYSAAASGRIEVVKFLLDKGLDANGHPKRGGTLLHNVVGRIRIDRTGDPAGAYRKRMKATASLLVARGAKVNIFSAVGLGMLDRLRAIIKTDPAKVHFTGPDGKIEQPLIWAARQGQLDAAKILLTDRKSVV